MVEVQVFDIRCLEFDVQGSEPALSLSKGSIFGVQSSGFDVRGSEFNETRYRTNTSS